MTPSAGRHREPLPHWCTPPAPWHGKTLVGLIRRDPPPSNTSQESVPHLDPRPRRKLALLDLPTSEAAAREPGGMRVCESGSPEREKLQDVCVRQRDTEAQRDRDRVTETEIYFKDLVPGL